MAQINCPACNTIVSLDLEACPDCGDPLTPLTPLELELYGGDGWLAILGKILKWSVIIIVLVPVSLIALAIVIGEFSTKNTFGITVGSEYVVTASSLNRRECASTDCKIVGQLSNGDTVTPKEVSGDWVRIDVGLESSWISGKYLKAE